MTGATSRRTGPISCVAGRRCRSGFKLGPLFADNDEVAQDLFTALASQIPAGEPLFLDVPDVNAGAVDPGRRAAVPG